MSDKPAYKSLCQTCVYQLHPVMLTTYCITNSACDRCGRVSDLALTTLAERKAAA